MKLFSPALELRTLRTLMNDISAKQMGTLFSELSEDSFHTSAAKESFVRVMTLMRERGSMPTWVELRYDPTLSEETRTVLRSFKKKPYEIEEAVPAIQSLHKFRQMRIMFHMARYTLEQLDKDSVDPDKLRLQVGEKLAQAGVKRNTKSWFTHFGKHDNSKKLIKDVLTYRPELYIPTGIKAFDNRNQGIPRGAFMLFAATTGGGKSVMIDQVGDNMALHGARVCKIPLEMDARQMTQRHLSRLADIDMPLILDPRKLSKKQRQKIEHESERFRKKLRRRDSMMSYFTPEEDMTIEEIMLAIRPFAFDVALIDYLGLLKGADGDDQWRQLGNIARYAKRYATINNMVMGAAAQLSQENVLRYSRAIAEHASNAWFWRFDDKAKETHIVRVEQHKSRNQQGFDFLLREDFARMRFLDLTEEEMDAYARESNDKEDNNDRRRKKSKDREGRAGRAIGKGEKSDKYFDV